MKEHINTDSISSFISDQTRKNALDPIVTSLLVEASQYYRYHTAFFTQIVSRLTQRRFLVFFANCFRVLAMYNYYCNCRPATGSNGYLDFTVTVNMDIKSADITAFILL